MTKFLFCRVLKGSLKGGNLFSGCLNFVRDYFDGERASCRAQRFWVTGTERCVLRRYDFNYIRMMTACA